MTDNQGSSVKASISYQHHEQNLKTPAIVIQTTPHKERNCVLTLYSPTLGLFSLYMKKSRKSALLLGSLSTPLTIAEFVVRPTRSQLYTFIEGSVLNAQESIKKSYDHLMAGIYCLDSLKYSQWKTEANPTLYAILIQLLSWIPTAQYPEAVPALFQIKILRLEGLFEPILQCTACGSKENLILCEGTGYCLKHAPYSGVEWKIEELKILNCGALIRNHAQFLDKQKELAYIAPKIGKLFKEISA